MQTRGNPACANDIGRRGITRCQCFPRKYWPRNSSRSLDATHQSLLSRRRSRRTSLRACCYFFFHSIFVLIFISRSTAFRSLQQRAGRNARREIDMRAVVGMTTMRKKIRRTVENVGNLAFFGHCRSSSHTRELVRFPVT